MDAGTSTIRTTSTGSINDATTASLSDEELRKVLKPIPTQDDIYKIVCECYVDTHVAAATSTTITSNEHTNTNNTATTTATAEYQKRVKIICQLESYDDCNYKVAIDERLYLLKITNGLESRDYIQHQRTQSSSSTIKQDYNDVTSADSNGSVIHFQHAIMNILHRNQISTSQPVASKSRHPDRPICDVTMHVLPVISSDHSPQLLAVRLYTWVYGRPMSTIPFIPIESFIHAGQMLGRIDHALDQLDHLRMASNDEPTAVANPSATPKAASAQCRYHQWDGRHTRDLRNFVSYIQNQQRRAMVESIISAFEEQILLPTATATLFRTGVIMGDYNDANIIVNENLQFAGVIDFGDSVESWRVLDITIAMAYAMLTSYGKSNRSLSAMAAILRGYHSVYPLTDIEREHLVLLVACRLACSVTLGAFSWQQNPHNTYLLLHSEPAWRALELIWGYDAEKREPMTNTLNCLFHRACFYEPDQNDSTNIQCSDLAIPDPCIVDLLATTRIPS